MSTIRLGATLVAAALAAVPAAARAQGSDPGRAGAGGTFGSYETLALTPELGLEAPTGSNTIFVFALPE